LREKHTALLFRTLGQVLHLLEDSAQPQHTRNDPHAGCADPLASIFGGHSWYEEYTEDRTLGRVFPRGDTPPPPIVLTGYAALPNRPYEGFFSNTDRRGMADFSSRNFLTVGTNLGAIPEPCDGLVEPPCFEEAYRKTMTAFTTQTLNGPIVGTVALYLRDVLDAETGAVIRDVPVSSWSMWDEPLVRRGRLPKFSLNRLNYVAMADILLPRAVGYAAGFLDTFFRGRLDGKVLPATPDQPFQRVRVINPLSIDDRPGERMIGTFAAFYDAADGQRVPVGQWPDQDVMPGASRELALASAPPDSPPPAEPGRYLVVFRGQLGTESDAVVAAWLDGRIWTLSLGATAYERDWTVVGPPFMTPQTFPAGPTYSHTLAGFDSSAAFYGEYLVASQEYYERAVMHPYTCQGPDYAPLLLGDSFRAEVHRYTAVYRGAAVAWGDPATLRVSGYGTSGNATTPVVVEVVRFKSPESLDELQSYSYDNPPTVEAVLYETTVSSEASVDVGPAELNGAAFIGVRVRPLPSYDTSVPETRRGSPLDTKCFQSLLRYGDLAILGAEGIAATALGGVELRIPISP
jgi:hypothetical protein